MNLRYQRKEPLKYDFSEQTKIIWHESEVKTYYDRPRNSLCLFRKAFEVKKAVKSAKVRLFADTRYVLYVNGIRAGRGPARSDPRWKLYDTVDISSLLNIGENVISAEVLYYGYGSGHSMDRIPAFFAETEIIFDDNKNLIISTNESWKCCLSSALNRNAPRINGCKGPIEVWDLREAEDFTSLSFDDSSWDNAKGRDAKNSPFWNLYPKTISNLEESYSPARAAIAGGIGKAKKGYDLPDLHHQIKAEIDELNLSHLYVLDSEGELPVIDKDEFNYVVFDFSKVLAGYISIDLTGYAGDIVDVVYSEELVANKPVFNNISYRPISRFILKDGENHLECKFNYEAFRYVYLIFRNHIRKIQLKKVGIITRTYPAEKLSSFECENEKLQRIWDISVHTLRLCMQDGFLDSPSREQQQWMGDGRFQAIMNYYVTGDCKMHEKLLLQIAQSQDMEGMTCSRYPDENHNLPPIPSFCLQWVCSFGDYYQFTGKKELICDLWNSIISAMRWFSGFENKSGLLENVPYWQYYDVSKTDDGKNADFFRGGVNALLNLMYLEAIKTVIDLSKVTKDFSCARFFKRKYQKLKNAIKKTLWDKEKGVYCDCLIGNSLSESVSEAVNAMAILHLHNPSDFRVKKIIKNAFDYGTKLHDIAKVSPYFMLPFYRAMKKAKRDDIALIETESRYTNMVESGATSTWEHWNLTEQAHENFVHSACHAWAAAPIVCVCEILLGIDPKTKKQARPHLTENYKAQIFTPFSSYNIKVENNQLKKNTMN